MACSESKRILCGDLDCDKCFHKSFAYHYEKALCWSNKNKISPLEVFKYSSKNFGSVVLTVTMNSKA